LKKKSTSNSDFKIIKKSNQLIEARYKFDVWESRMFLSVLSNIRKEDADFQTYRVRYRDIIKIFGLKSNQSYSFLREAAKSLMQKKFYISSTDNGFERETAYHIIRSVNYLKEGQSGEGVEQQEYIDITVEPEMKPLLLQLQQNFTAYNIQNVAKLGASALRLYELLKQYERIGNRTMDIDHMKHILEMESEYPLFADFFKWFIKPAIRDINLYSDLQVEEPERIKQGKKVVSLHFVIRKKKDSEPIILLNPREVDESTGPSVKTLILEDNDLVKQYFERLNDWWGVQKGEFQKRLTHKTAQDIEIAIEFTKMRVKTGKATNPAGVFLDALSKGHKSAEQAQMEKKANKEKLEKEKQVSLRPLSESYNRLLDDYAQKVNDTIREITQTDPSVTEHVIEKIKALFRSMGDKRVEGKTLEDFRKNEFLRGLVKREIMF
jgi:plasmid replication initiation protein